MSEEKKEPAFDVKAEMRKVTDKMESFIKKTDKAIEELNKKWDDRKIEERLSNIEHKLKH